MKSTSRLMGVIAAAALIVTALPVAWAQPSVLFAERFDDTLDRGWRFVRSHRKTRKVEGGKLHVQTRPGSLYQEGNNASNVMLRTLPRSDVPMLAEVELEFRPQALHENAGLVYYIDDDNYVLVDVGAHQEGSQPVRVQMLREVAGAGAVAHDAPSTGARIFLGMRITADEITGLYRYASTDMWEVLGSVPRPEAPGARIGLEASNGAPGVERWAVFDDFRLLTLE